MPINSDGRCHLHGHHPLDLSVDEPRAVFNICTLQVCYNPGVMAPAKQVACAEPYAGSQDWLVDLLKIRFEEVLRHRGAALDPADVEGVHEMRVATRRLRGALSDVDGLVGSSHLKRLSRKLKKLADGLGAVRDHDVAMLALQKLTAETNDPSIRQGIEPMIADRRALRQGRHLDLLSLLSINFFEELQERFSSVLKTVIVHGRSIESLSPSEAGREIILARMDEASDLGPNVYKPFSRRPLHKLRIASKHLRYAIEVFGNCWNGAADPFAAEVAKLQSALGEVHDCDQWITALSKRLKRGNGKHQTGSPEAAAWLLSEFVKKRSKEYRAALDIWTEWKTKDFVNRLRTVISA